MTSCSVEKSSININAVIDVWNIFLCFAGIEHVELAKNVINGKTVFLGSKKFVQIMEIKNMHSFVNDRTSYLRKVIWHLKRRKRRKEKLKQADLLCTQLTIQIPRLQHLNYNTSHSTEEVESSIMFRSRFLNEVSTCAMKFSKIM